MKLNEVPTDMLRLSLLAVQDLRRKYKGEQMATLFASGEGGRLLGMDWDCPLCNLAESQNGKDIFHATGTSRNCKCPWFWIEGHRCCDGRGHTGYHSSSIPDRLLRIDRWEAAINAELATRKEAP